MKFSATLPSKPVKSSLLKMNDKYEILWKEPKAKQGYFKTHSIIVYGLDAVEHVLETLLKDVDNYDVIPRS